MNRIYQGRVTRIDAKKEDGTFEQVAFGQDQSSCPLWRHHAIFQDAVNYYIVALASLGSTRESNLTKLRELLEKVWAGFDKKGQCRQGMRDSLQRAWQLTEPPEALETEIILFHARNYSAFKIVNPPKLPKSTGSFRNTFSSPWISLCDCPNRLSKTIPIESHRALWRLGLVLDFASSKNLVDTAEPLQYL